MGFSMKRQLNQASRNEAMINAGITDTSGGGTLRILANANNG
jgi:hypothetical protein